MPTLYNVDSQAAVVSHSARAVQPGDSHDFTDEEVAAGLGGAWSELAPRRGLPAERDFKRRRDAVVETETPEPDAQVADPAPSGDQKED